MVVAREGDMAQVNEVVGGIYRICNPPTRDVPISFNLFLIDDERPTLIDSVEKVVVAALVADSAVATAGRATGLARAQVAGIGVGGVISFASLRRF
jgi:hypothetical protein